MSTPRVTSFHPDEWVEEKIIEGKARAQECREELENSIVRHPLGAVALGFGAGYLARSLPLPRVIATTVRIGLAFAPHVLLGLGAVRAWKFLREDADRVGPLPKLRELERDPANII